MLGNDVIGDDRRKVRILRDIGHFRRLAARVHQHRHRAAHGGRKERFNELDARREQYVDMVSGLDAQRLKSTSALKHAPDHLIIGFAFAREDQGFLVRKAIPGLQEKVPRVVASIRILA
jgi:hypothetical protein